MSLDDVVNVSITETASALSGVGFGTPLILPPHHTHFAELLRYYTDPSQMITDGFLATDQAYIEAVSVMTQRPRPTRFAVGLRATAVAQLDTVGFVLHGDGAYTLTITINGVATPFTFNAAGSSVIQIRDGLISAINAGAIGVTAAIGDATHLTIVSGTAGIPFVCAATASPASDMTVVVTTPNTGITEDLIAINAFQPDWYGLLITQRDLPNIRVAAAQIETMRKIFLAQSSAAAILALPYNVGTPATDIASLLHSLNYARTAVFYHPTDADSLAGAMMGIGLAQIPASITWKFKLLVGVAATRLTPTQRTNLTSKQANGYEPLAQLSSTYEGTVASGEFIDIIHGIDKLRSQIQLLVGTTLMQNPKVPYTTAGIAQIAAQVRTALQQSSREGLIALSRTLADGSIQVPAFTITPPAIQDIPANSRSSRIIPTTNPIVFEGTLAGAIHAVNVTGTLSV